jgi:hypothetical protein
MDDDTVSELHREGALCVSPVHTSSSTQASHEEEILAELDHLPTSTADPAGTPTVAIVTPTPAFSGPMHTPRRTFSIAHDDFLSERIIIFHVDLEHSGKEAGIVQLSVVAYNPSQGEYCGEFNEYIQPPKNAKWDERAMQAHGIRPNQERIMNADSLIDVWPRFVSFVESRLDNGGRNGIIAA